MFTPEPVLSDEVLLNEYRMALARIHHWTEEAGRNEWEIKKRMEARGATAIPSDIYICEMISKNSYDKTRFAPLKELLTSVDLASCLVPAHEVTHLVEDKWNTVKVKALARRYGNEAQRVV